MLENYFLGTVFWVSILFQWYQNISWSSGTVKNGSFQILHADKHLKKKKTEFFIVNNCGKPCSDLKPFRLKVKGKNSAGKRFQGPAVQGKKPLTSTSI